MSIGPLGGLGASAAGSPLAQTKGSDVEKAQEENALEQRRLESEKRAQTAAGVGQTDGEDHETGERNADGRRPWEGPSPSLPAADKAETPQSQDTSGQRGNLLDLSG